MNEIEDSFNRLNDISLLTHDEKGYQAEAFKPALINKCKKIISLLSYQPEIFPTSRQSIQLEFEKADGSYLEFEIFEDKTSYLYIFQFDYDNAIERELTDEYEEIPRIVEEFYFQH